MHYTAWGLARRRKKRGDNNMTMRNHALLLGLLALACAGRAAAGPIDIFRFSSFISSSTLGGTSLSDTRIGVGGSEFAANGFAVSFGDGLNGDNLGTLSYSITNNTGMDLVDAMFFGYLDADLDETLNSFFNEIGDASGLALGGGAGDMLADAFEIDEPGFAGGDIFANLLAGMLANDNAVGAGNPDDVALALGFELGTWAAGQTLTATFDISLTDNGGLFHYDPDSDFGFFFNGSAGLSTVSTVSEPGILGLVGVGLILLLGSRRLR